MCDALQVAREVYNTCLMGALKGKTRVLVTNQLQFVSGANSVVYMQDGKIQERGTYDELMKSDKGFAQLMSSAEVMQLRYSISSISCWRYSLLDRVC